MLSKCCYWLGRVVHDFSPSTQKVDVYKLRPDWSTQPVPASQGYTETFSKRTTTTIPVTVFAQECVRTNVHTRESNEEHQDSDFVFRG